MLQLVRKQLPWAPVVRLAIFFSQHNQNIFLFSHVKDLFVIIIFLFVIRIFSAHKETDVGMLHSENGIQSNHCSYMPHQLISKTDRFVYDNFYAHMPATKFLIEGNVEWNILYLNLVEWTNLERHWNWLETYWNILYYNIILGLCTKFMLCSLWIKLFSHCKHDYLP